ncbi:MAG: alpha-galactosidase [Kiritimatiellae bacterium]|nr:alpha-galactosidase [Kiritimatiellia bacterium]
MKPAVVFACIAVAGAVHSAPDGAWEGFAEVFKGDVAHILCAEPDGWKFAVETRALEEGRSELVVRLRRENEARPPKFLVEIAVPTGGAKYIWTPYGGDGLPAEWAGFFGSNIASSAPIYCFKDPHENNVFTVASSEAERNVSMQCGVRETVCRLGCTWRMFEADEAPIKEYETKFLFDRRTERYGKIAADASRWISQANGYTDAFTPESAFEPLYSSWYAFHHEVKDETLLAELEKASKLGMKTLIIDDGWETADNGTDFRFSGDWKVAPERFADIGDFVKKAHALGIKVMMWYSVAFVGHDSANRERFKGKFLDESDTNMGICVLDPRFPEVREFIVSTLADAVESRGLDGLKLDFIDCFRIYGADPAVAEDYAGRDFRHIPAAVDRLMTDIHDRLCAINPDVLIEFRQSYTGPAIRQYGNMLRVADCPGNSLANRRGIANLRTISGGTAVHSDMLMWNFGETAQSAALNIIDSIFGVVQYSVVLGNAPEEHLRMMANWIDFTLRHKDALLRGGFVAHNPELGYPLVEGFGKDENVSAVYGENTVAPVAAGKKTYVLNGTLSERIFLDNAGGARKTSAFDTFGEKTAEFELGGGLNAVAVPPAGYLEIAP